ncbi:MAG: serine/threonine protein kinase [Candidatus Sericytochromatia bacterium]|nr:serine/threonine protein kinase [Candidatus Sericytochromatia bacterium]
MLLDDFIEDLEEDASEDNVKQPQSLEDIVKQHPCITAYDLSLLQMLAEEQSLSLQAFLAKTGILPEQAFLKIKLMLQGMLPINAVDMYGLFDLKALRETMESSQLEYLGYPPVNYQIQRYRLLKELGTGGSSRVYLAEHPKLKRKVAVKVLSPFLANRSPAAVEQFFREGRIYAQLSHPAFAQIYDAEEVESYHYLVMEYVPGSNLEDILVSHPYMPLYNILVISGQLTQALEHLHDHGFIHRDIKPENIVMTPQSRIKLLDLGIALEISASKYQQENTLIQGSPYFISPEHLNNRTDIRSDIYSLGAVLYTLATGKLPFNGDNLQEVLHQHLHSTPPPPHEQRQDIPEHFSELILNMLAKNPAERPQSCVEVLDTLGLITARYSKPHGRSVVALMREFLGV